MWPAEGLRHAFRHRVHTNDDASPARVPALDGVRGVAILLVLAHHFAVHAVPKPATGWWRAAHTVAADYGWMGVDLFFVLSGFLITTILWQTRDRDGFFRSFYARRALRIFPLYFAFLAVVIGVLPLLAPQNPRLQAWAQQAPWYSTYTINFLLARNNAWSGSSEQGLEHFWSLAVEEQFYLLWPVAVYCLRRQTLIFLAVACGLTSIAVRLALLTSGHAMAAYVLMPARMDALAAGALVALLATAPERLRQMRAYAVPVGVAATIVLSGLLLTRGPFWSGDVAVQTIGFTLIAAACAGLLIGAVTIGPVSRVHATPVLRFFGRYSYGLYVFHHPLLFLVPSMAGTVTALGYEPSASAARVVAIVAAGALSLAAAMASYHLLEQPFLRMNTRFQTKPVEVPRL